MPEHTANTIIEAEVSLKVIRCKCGDPSTHLEAVCPVGVTEDLGVVAHTNPTSSEPGSKGANNT